MKEWWINLSIREKQVVILGSVFLSIFFMYEFFWSPFLTTINHLRTRTLQEEKLLSWMKGADAEIKLHSNNYHDKKSQVSPAVLLSYLQTKINTAGLSQNLTQLKQSTNEIIEIHFQKVDFDRLISLLIMIANEQHIKIDKMSVVADNMPGMVNADIYLNTSLQ